MPTRSATEKIRICRDSDGNLDGSGGLPRIHVDWMTCCYWLRRTGVPIRRSCPAMPYLDSCRRSRDPETQRHLTTRMPASVGTARGTGSFDAFWLTNWTALYDEVEKGYSDEDAEHHTWNNKSVPRIGHLAGVRLIGRRAILERPAERVRHGVDDAVVLAHASHGF